MSNYGNAHRHASSVVPLLAHHQMLCYCSLAKLDSRTKNKGPASQNLNVLDDRISACSILSLFALVFVHLDPRSLLAHS